MFIANKSGRQLKSRKLIGRSPRRSRRQGTNWLACTYAGPPGLDPGYRRCGIATALTREALRLTGESGRGYATLQASRQGAPVYRNMGFQAVGRYRLFRFPA